MGNIISVLYILAFAGCGILTARPIFASDRPLKRILFGLTFGLVMLLWLPVLFAFILDFTLAAQILALAAAVFIAGVSTFFAVKKQKNGKIKYKAASKRDLVPLLVTIVPLVAVGWILHANHTITNASDGSLHVGQCTFGDLCMHYHKHQCAKNVPAELFASAGNSVGLSFPVRQCQFDFLYTRSVASNCGNASRTVRFSCCCAGCVLFL